MSYDIAQICLNGHVINSNFQRAPHLNTNFCEKCGEQTITTCSKCDRPIKGEIIEDELPNFEEYIKPLYCQYCGSAFPWTETSIQAALTISMEEGKLDATDKAVLEESFRNVVKNGPQAQVAANKIKKIMTKAGKTTAGAVRDILVDIISETTKRIIWPNHD